jgi:hypothetical protein
MMLWMMPVMMLMFSSIVAPSGFEPYIMASTAAALPNNM